jgi:hypothetical protein
MIPYLLYIWKKVIHENDRKGYKISDPLFIAWIKENIIDKT